MRLLKLFAAFIFVTGTAFCQTNWPPPMILAAPPAGGCPNGILAVDIVANNLYFCAGGSWHLANGGGTVPRLDQILNPTAPKSFDLGTHALSFTNGAVQIGNGGIFSATGTGTITATATPFSGVSTGTNAVALHIGTGGTLDATGTGTITATAYSGTTTGTAGTPMVLQGQPSVNGVRFLGYSGLASPAAPTVVDVPGGGTLLANTQYCYRTNVTSGVGTSAVSSETCVTTSSDALNTHAVTVTSATVSGAAAYGFYGRPTVGGHNVFIDCKYLSTATSGTYNSNCTSSATPNIYLDTGAITPVVNSNKIIQAESQTGLGFGSTAGTGPSLTGIAASASPTDVWLYRTSLGYLGVVTGSTGRFGRGVIDFGNDTATGPLTLTGSMASGFQFAGSGISMSTAATGGYIKTTQSYMQSGVRTAILSVANATATCDMIYGNTCWIKPVGGTNVTTLVVSDIVANGLGYDFCVLQDGTGGSTVTFAAAPFHGTWTPGTTASLSSCAHFSSPDGTNLLLTGHTENQ